MRKVLLVDELSIAIPQEYARPNEACAALWYVLHHLGDVLADLAQTRGIVGRQVKRLKELELENAR